MPFTPFHFGPAIFLGLLLRKYIDFPTFVIANVVVDARALLVFFDMLNGPIHGFLHTYFFATQLGLLLAGVMYYLEPYTGEAMELFRLEQLNDWRRFVAAGLLGAWIHVTLDSFLYTDIQPFILLNTNPFHGFFAATPYIEIYGLCILAFVLGMIYYIYLYADLSGGDKQRKLFTVVKKFF